LTIQKVRGFSYRFLVSVCAFYHKKHTLLIKQQELILISLCLTLLFHTMKAKQTRCYQSTIEKLVIINNDFKINILDASKVQAVLYLQNPLDHLVTLTLL